MHISPARPLLLATLVGFLASPIVHAQAVAPRGLDLLEPYVDRWIGEQHRETTDGRGYRFEYILAWFDEPRTIIEMTINRRYDDGDHDLIWSGFKGWDAVRGETYYHGFSAEGRVGRGLVVPADGDYAVDTVYEGIAASGAVRIRDRFTAIRDDAFTSVTEMERDGVWVEVSRDSWKRQSATRSP